jgi:hypothetical protein
VAGYGNGRLGIAGVFTATDAAPAPGSGHADGSLHGTFAIARMQSCFQVAVKIATVVAASPKGGSHAGSRVSTAAWAGLA